MAELNKAIGLRIPPKLWEEIKEYGLENYPGSKGKEGFDVTKTIVSLLTQALENPSDSIIQCPDVSSDERIVELIKQELDKAVSPTNNDVDSALIDILARLEALEGTVDVKSQLPPRSITKTATKANRKVD